MIYVKLLLVAVFWGATFVSARALSTELHLSASIAGFCRFVIASGCFAAVLWRSDKGFPSVRRGLWPWLFVAGATGVAGYTYCFFKGLQWISGSRASILVALNPLVISLVSVWWLGERFHIAKLLGTLLAISGALTVITGGHPSWLWHGGFGPGEAWISGCLLTWAIYSLVGKRLMREMSALAAVSYSSWIGTLLLLPLALYDGLLPTLPTLSIGAWSQLAYFGVFATVLAFLWYYDGIRELGATRASLCINLVPICAAFFGWWLLDEPLTVAFVLGGGLVLSGVALHNRGSQRAEPLLPDDGATAAPSR